MTRLYECRTLRSLPALSLVAICGLTTPVAAVAQSDTEADVIAVIEGFHTALASGDSVQALRHLAEDVVILESGGVEDKDHYRSGHLAGDMRFAAAVPRERGDIAVRVLGSVAWAHSTSVTQGTMGEREINAQGAELVVLVHDGDAWKISAIHWSSRQRRASN